MGAGSRSDVREPPGWTVVKDREDLTLAVPVVFLLLPVTVLFTLFALTAYSGNRRARRRLRRAHGRPGHRCGEPAARRQRRHHGLGTAPSRRRECAPLAGHILARGSP